MCLSQCKNRYELLCRIEPCSALWAFIHPTTCIDHCEFIIDCSCPMFTPSAIMYAVGIQGLAYMYRRYYLITKGETFNNKWSNHISSHKPTECELAIFVNAVPSYNTKQVLSFNIQRNHLTHFCWLLEHALVPSENQSPSFNDFFGWIC